MCAKIFRLPEDVINQIKAGEVVENPASIIKELIENSIDAGASIIKVTIVGGGQLSIEVEDNGCGMNAEDAVLSLERHATSKIKTAEDLSVLATMGFRGEAIAAIASVSILEIKTFDGKEGAFVKATGGIIDHVTPVARNQGTTITVKSLFFNTPARKKFQKSASANAAQVTKVIETMALAHPQVHFYYYSGEEKIYDFKPADHKDRIEAVLGSFEHVGKMDNLWGLFSCPTQAKSTRRSQYLFVNKRPIFSPIVAKAVQTGYSTRLKEGMYPSFVLFVEIDPAKVDVNVHPQKKEVRFSHESELFSDVERLVRSIFDKESIQAPFVNFEFTPPPIDFSKMFAKTSVQVFENPVEEQNSFEEIESKETKHKDFFSESAISKSVESLESGVATFFKESDSVDVFNGSSFKSKDLILENQKREKFRFFENRQEIKSKPLFVLGKYFLVERLGLVLVDLEAARFRVFSDQIKNKNIQTQKLMFPVELVDDEESTIEKLQEIGFECHRMGMRTIVIEAIPSFLDSFEVKSFFEAFKEGKSFESTLQKFSKSQNKNYSLEQASHIFSLCLDCSDSIYDPSGKKIQKQLSVEDMQRLLLGKF